MVLSLLKRTKLDPNREVEEAAQGDPLAIQAWEEYHSSIESAKSTFNGQGIVFDLHGQGHLQNSTEVGYLLSKTQLNDGFYDTSVTSVKSLAEITGVENANMIIGEESFGAFLENQGFNALPSPRQPSPGLIL